MPGVTLHCQFVWCVWLLAMYKDEKVRHIMAIFQEAWFANEDEEEEGNEGDAEEGDEEEWEGSYQVELFGCAICLCEGYKGKCNFRSQATKILIWTQMPCPWSRGRALGRQKSMMSLRTPKITWRRPMGSQHKR